MFANQDRYDMMFLCMHTRTPVHAEKRQNLEASMCFFLLCHGHEHGWDGTGKGGKGALIISVLASLLAPFLIGGLDSLEPRA